ncbi:MAG: hypothetical protein AAFW00_11750 [Bacteroidota bacterium]
MRLDSLNTSIWTHICAFGLILGIFPSRIFGQEVQFSFNRQNNFTYLTRLDAKWQFSQGKYSSEGYVHHDNLFNAARTQSPFVQLFVSAQAWQYWALSPRVQVASWLELDQFWNTRNQRYSFYLGSQYRPIEGVEVTPLLGYSWDYRSQRLDQGLSPALRVRAQQSFEPGLQMETHLLARWKFINPRRQRNIDFGSYWLREFGPNSLISASVEVGSNEMDDYKSQSVERIEADTGALALNLRYEVAPDWIWESENRLVFSRRSFTYDPYLQSESEFNNLRFGQQDLILRQRLSFQKPKVYGALSYTYAYLQRRYELENTLELIPLEFNRLEDREQQKDYFRRQHEWDARLTLPLNRKNQFQIEGYNRYVQYDTPSEDNFDDHDELNYTLKLDWQKRWSSKFQTRYRLIGGVRRYAFLFAERSQDNYTQRNLRLEFDYQWQPLAWLRLKGAHWVYVTYNVKDFADPNLTDRSTRNLETRWDLNMRLKPRWKMEAGIYRREVHVSYLDWERFTETTLDTTTTWQADMNHVFRLKKKWLKQRIILEGGYQQVSRLRFQNTSMTSLENILTPINLRTRIHQIGPKTGIRFLNRGGESLKLNIWWQWQVQSFRYKEIEDFTTLSANFDETVLQKVTTDFRPFILLRFRLAL